MYLRCCYLIAWTSLLGLFAAVGSARATTTDSTILELIRELESPSFAVRQNAQNVLIATGEQAIVPVRKASSHQDREVRERCALILQQLEVGRRDRRLAQFLSGATSDSAEAVPGWVRLASICGDCPATRRLLVAMLRADWRLVQAAQDPNRIEVFESLFVRRCDDLSALRRKTRANLPRGRVAALLFVGAQHGRVMTDRSKHHVYGFCYQLGNLSRLSNDDLTLGPLRALMGDWILQSNDPNHAYLGITLALRFSLAEGLTAAERLLSNEELQPHILQTAILAIAKFGSEGHCEPLLPLLDHKGVCARQVDASTRITYVTQIRDVALATLLHLSGEAPNEYGFSRVKTNPIYPFLPNSLGFADDESRSMAQARWRAYRAERDKLASN